MNLTEKVSRALCWSNGMDPDTSLGGDKQNWLWMEYEHQAEEAIKAVNGTLPLIMTVQGIAKAYKSAPGEQWWIDNGFHFPTVEALEMLLEGKDINDVIQKFTHLKN